MLANKSISIGTMEGMADDPKVASGDTVTVMVGGKFPLDGTVHYVFPEDQTIHVLINSPRPRW